MNLWEHLLPEPAIHPKFMEMSLIVSIVQWEKPRSKSQKTEVGRSVSRQEIRDR